jgi:hypothetical protein
MYPAGFGKHPRMQIKGPWNADYPKDKEKHNTDFAKETLIRAGFTKEQAERKIREGEDKRSWKHLSPEDRMQTEIEGKANINEIFKFKNQNPKKVNVVGEDEPKVEQPIPMSVLESVSDTPPKTEPKEDDWFTVGMIRRPGKGKRITKTLTELEKEFTKAVDNFTEEYGVSFERGTYGPLKHMRGKRASGTIMAKGSKDITETEIMAASVVSKNISLPYGKALTDLQIACPNKNADESKKGKIKEVIKESAKKTDEKTTKKTKKTKKVEKKPSVVIRVRRAVAKKINHSVIRLATGAIKLTSRMSV